MSKTSIETIIKVDTFAKEDFSKALNCLVSLVNTEEYKQFRKFVVKNLQKMNQDFSKLSEINDRSFRVTITNLYTKNLKNYLESKKTDDSKQNFVINLLMNVLTTKFLKISK